MVDEMYRQKGTQFHGGEYIGADEDENLYKGIVVLMVSMLEQLLQIIILLMSVHLMLLKKYETDSAHPDNNNKTYLFYDNVHFIKNIRNNLFNAKKFVFPAISLNIGGEVVCSPAGFISWKDLHHIYDEDEDEDEVTCEFEESVQTKLQSNASR